MRDRDLGLVSATMHNRFEVCEEEGRKNLDARTRVDGRCGAWMRRWGYMSGVSIP